MKLAVFSDIHGNFEALESIYNDIKKQKVDEIIYLGDAIGIGPQPIKCLEFMMNHPDITMILGNHEERQMQESDVDFYKEGNRHHLWVHEKIKKKHLDFINNLPIFIEREYHNKKFFFSHFFLKSLKHNQLYYPIDIMEDKKKLQKLKKDTNYDYIFIGHNHNNYEYKSLHIIDVGTSGCVYDNKTSYYLVNILDEVTIEKKIIEYDRESFEKSFKGFDNEHNLSYRFFGVKLDDK
ncbi:MAG: metallophosphoesterase family protein [Bacilli bacterium]|nr:metallophosphoesterase family protein [Bacilli bacterium]